MNQPRRIQGEIDMDILAPIGEKQARMKPPLVLAYIGDTVYDLYARASRIKSSGAGVGG